MGVAGVVNWKTTAGALVQAVGLVLVGFAAPALMGGDANFGDVVADPRFQAAFGLIISGIGGVITGFFARDKDKSSQDQQPALRPPVDPASLDAEIKARVQAELKAAGIK